MHELADAPLRLPLRARAQRGLRRHPRAQVEHRARHRAGEQRGGEGAAAACVRAHGFRAQRQRPAVFSEVRLRERHHDALGRDVPRRGVLQGGGQRRERGGVVAEPRRVHRRRAAEVRARIAGDDVGVRHVLRAGFVQRGARV